MVSIRAIDTTEEEAMNPQTVASMAAAHVADLHRTAAEYRRAQLPRRSRRVGGSRRTRGNWRAVSTQSAHVAPTR